MVYFEVWGIEQGETEKALLYKFPEVPGTSRQDVDTMATDLGRQGVTEVEVKEVEE